MSGHRVILNMGLVLSPLDIQQKIWVLKQKRWETDHIHELICECDWFHRNVTLIFHCLYDLCKALLCRSLSVWGSKTLICPHQKKFTKSDFMSIESTVNISKVSIFKVSNFLENKMSTFGWNNVTLSFSVTLFMQKF